MALVQVVTTTSKIIPGVKNDDYWRSVLTTEQYHILREAGTEAPFTGMFNHESRNGTYFSFGCDKPLFRSEQKFDSGTGWPSFWAPISQDSIVLRKEKEGDDRIEVLDTCGGHLGHVFDDGPPPTGKRYCMNSIALRFVPDKK
ncbi:MAG: peptide-methionine (R)-S-oxide reductase MsrB [Microgenomates group bacterium]